MPKIYVITGVPGTGKTTLARSISKRLKNSIVISANNIAKDKGLLIKKDIDGAFPVNIKKLNKSILAVINKNNIKNKKYIILEGHLLCEMKLKGATVIVLRSHIKQLELRLKARKYPLKKISENILSEATDYCGVMALKNYTNVYELLGNKKQVLKQALKIINGDTVISKEFDLLNELNQINYNKYLC